MSSDSPTFAALAKSAATMLDAASLEAILNQARGWPHSTAWAWYRAGEQLHLEGQGDAQRHWPAVLANHELQRFCESCSLQIWPTGQGEAVLGWLMAPLHVPHDGALAELAATIGRQVQTDALARAQITQRVLYEITYLASSTRDRSVFLVGVHKLLATLIDAENFYLALYDAESGKITYPYYVDVIDVEALEAENYEYLDPAHLSLTGHVLTSGQALLTDAKGIAAAQQQRRFYCVGHIPEFWMGSPLKNARDQVFGMIAMQVYDVERSYSAEDRALFLVVARHVAMALDRILHRADLEETVSRRTQELSQLNAALRLEVSERKRAEHLQVALSRSPNCRANPARSMASTTACT